MTLINPNRHTALDAARLLDEYDDYCADGPPYDGPNRGELMRRDNQTRRALSRRAYPKVLATQTTAKAT